MTFPSKWILVLVLAGAASAGTFVRAEPGTVEGIEVYGLYRMTKEAFLHAFAVRAGDPYDPARIRTSFKKLWDLGLWSDLVVEAEDGPSGGKILIVKVKERQVLTTVSYEDNKVLTRTQIEDRLKERKVSLDVGKPLNMKAVFDAESTIREYLAEKGYLDAKVSHRVDQPTEASSAVSFSIRPGGKTRIRSIRFVGNEVFPDGKLLRQLKLTRPQSWYRPWSSKALYHPAKWDQDVGGIRDLYLNNGYLDVDIRPPVIEVEVAAADQPEETQKRPGAEPSAPSPTAETSKKESEKAAKKEEEARKNREKAEKKADSKTKRWVDLTIPISEGSQYRTGKITATGNTVLEERRILALVPLREGDVVSELALKAGEDMIRDTYGNKGYLYATLIKQIQKHADEKIADIQFVITEDKPYYVSRIEFTGNTLTHDKVLRREMALNEGDLFRRNFLDVSANKVNQLGYFEAKERPVIEPIEGEDRVKITVNGEEKARNEIQVGGGYSGAQGAFFNGIFSTRNFLGRGQIVSVTMQLGARTNYYSLSFQEPWFLGRPYTFGASVYRQQVDYGGNFQTSNRGFGAMLGKRIGFYSSVDLAYSFQRSTSRTVSIFNRESTNQISSLTPMYSYDRVNNPYRPSRGWRLAFSTQIAGGPLGGDTDFLKPALHYTGFRRVWKSTFIGVHTELGQVWSWLGVNENDINSVYGIPASQRYWIGGDTYYGPRVFEIRTVTPRRFVRLDSYGRVVEAIRDPSGRPVKDFDRNGDGVLDSRDLAELGGNRYYLVQTEWVVPVSEPVEAAFFLDAGSSLFEDTPWGFHELRLAAGVEMRFFLPVFPVPLRLIYGWPLRSVERDRTGNFTFSIGRSF